MTTLSVPDLALMLDDYIESVTDERKPDGRYHPSSMFGCDRKTLYEVRGTPPDSFPDAKSKRRFYVGHRLHEVIQRTLEAHPDIEDFYPEFEVDVPAYNVRGHGDGLVKYRGQWWLLEVKSIKKAGVRMGIPKPEHESQAITYWWAVKNHPYKIHAAGMAGMRIDDDSMLTMPPMGGNLVGILMLYVEKEDLNVYQTVLIPDDDSWEAMVEAKISDLDMWRTDSASLPPRLPRDKKTGRKNWLCGYCPFATRCWDSDPAVVLPSGAEDI